MKKAIYKVPNGKLLKVFLEDMNGKIAHIEITGDFFMYPEENVEALERALHEIPLTEESLRTAITSFLEKNQTTLYGLDTDSLVTTILTASIP